MAFGYKSLFSEEAPKVRPFLALLFTTLLSVLLVWQRGVRSIGTFHDAVMADPATAAFVKQIVAGLLGAIWLYAAGSIFNLTTRLRLASPNRTPSLQALNIWAAVGSQRVDFSLPVNYLMLTLAVVLVGHAIGSLWGGAIAPVSLPAQFLDDDNLLVPLFTPPWFTNQFPHEGDDKDFDDTIGEQCRPYNAQSGFIPTCPVPGDLKSLILLWQLAHLISVGLQNLILDSASSATTYDGKPRIHSKNDNPQWSYVGRSYGVGSSQGITNRSFTRGDLLGYNYTEVGYLVETHCSLNTTSAFKYDNVLSNFQPANGSDVSLNIFVARGTLPNADDEADFITFPVVLTNRTNNADNELLTWAANSKNGANMISIVGSGSYAEYNLMQCSVNFTQAEFHVEVNVTSSIINVTLLDWGQNLQDRPFDENHHLKSNTMAALSLLAQTTSSVAFEALGQSLTDNWRTSNQSISNANLTFDTDQEFEGNATSIFQAADDSFNAMIDDILLGYGAAQLFWGLGRKSSDASSISRNASVTSTYDSIRLGQDGYIFATLAINILLIVIGLEEAIRTRNWKQMPLLDYLDLKSMIVATSAGGKDIWEDCNNRHPEGSAWDGDNSNKEAASVRVRLGQGSDPSTGRQPVIMLAQAAKQDGAADNGSEDGIPLKGWHSEQ